MLFQKAEFECSAYTVQQLPVSDLPEIIFSGRSNVGKSSMINRLAGRKNLARVSSAPGKTASVNFYRCEGFRLVDLPGYGFAKVSRDEKQKWAELVEGYFGQPRQFALVIQLIDSRRRLTPEDAEMIGYMKTRSLSYLLAMTKTDKLGKTEFKKRIAEVPSETDEPIEKIVFFSAQNGSGAEEIEKHAQAALENAGTTKSDE